MFSETLPPNWSWVKLSDVGDVVAGGTPSTIVNEYFDGEIAWITPADLTGYSNKYISKGRRNISLIGLKNSSARIVPKGSILFSSRAPIGYVAIASNEICTNQGFKNLIPNKKVDSEFVYYYLKSAKQLAEKNASGTTFKEISSTNFKQLPIPLPPLPEQKKIVEKIEELFSGLDSGVASLKKAKAQIRLYRQSVLASAFSGCLHPRQGRGRHDSSDYTISRIKGKKSSKSVNPANPGSDNLPPGWKWVKLGEVITFLGSGITPRGGRNVYKTEGIKFIRSQNVYPNQLVLEEIAYITEDIDEKMKRSRVKPLDVLLNITGASIGRVANIPESFGPANVNQHVCIIRTNQNDVGSKYLSLYLNSNFAQQHINRIQIGATRQALNYSQIKMFPFPLCPLIQQTQIVEEIEKRFSEADNLEKAIDDSLTKAETLRQSILKQAFEGKLV